MKRTGMALIVVLALVISGCGGSGGVPGAPAGESSDWETISGNQVSKLIQGFDDEDIEMMGSTLAAEVVFVTSTSPKNPEPISKNLVLWAFEIVFDEPGDSIRNVLKGPMDIRKSGDVVTVTLNIEYVSDSYRAQTWIFKLKEQKGTWLIYYWEIQD